MKVNVNLPFQVGGARIDMVQTSALPVGRLGHGPRCHSSPPKRNSRELMLEMSSSIKRASLLSGCQVDLWAENDGQMANPKDGESHLLGLCFLLLSCSVGK